MMSAVAGGSGLRAVGSSVSGGNPDDRRRHD